MRASSVAGSLASFVGNDTLTLAPSRSPAGKNGNPGRGPSAGGGSGGATRERAGRRGARSRAAGRSPRRAGASGRRRRGRRRRMTCFRRNGGSRDPVTASTRESHKGDAHVISLAPASSRRCPADSSSRRERSMKSASKRATRHGVTAMLLNVRTPPSRCARSASSAPGPYSARRSPSYSMRTTPSRINSTSVPGSPCWNRTAPSGNRSMRRLPPACITWAESAVSSANSTAVTRASESSSPQELCFPNDLRLARPLSTPRCARARRTDGPAARPKRPSPSPRQRRHRDRSG